MYKMTIIMRGTPDLSLRRYISGSKSNCAAVIVMEVFLQCSDDPNPSDNYWRTTKQTKC